MTETATRTSCRGLGEAGSVAEPTTSTTRRLPPFFRPLLTLLGIREQEQEVVSSSDGAGASALPPPSSGPSRRRQSDDRPNTDRMGNCLKSPTSDDVSLLREGPSSRFGHTWDLIPFTFSWPALLSVLISSKGLPGFDLKFLVFCSGHSSTGNCQTRFFKHTAINTLEIMENFEKVFMMHLSAASAN